MNVVAPARDRGSAAASAVAVVAAIALTALVSRALPAQETDGPQIRVALLVGSNEGAAPHRPLRFAEEDARRVRTVLQAVGGFAQQDLHLLVGPTEQDLQAAFRAVSDRLLEADGRRTLVLFYFSGHSDGTGLELGADRVPFATVKAWLEGTGASVKVAVVDACLSGQFTSTKGVSREPAFEIDVSGDLATSGTAVLTSSGAGEVAQESGEVSGSFFTHHLVSGLYGAADDNRDLSVTLREAYQYAYRRTVGDTAANLAGAQHPGYSLRLEGHGDLVLTRVTEGSAIILFPAGTGGTYFLLSSPEREVVAEVVHKGDGPRRLFVPPGSFRLLRRERGAISGTTIAVNAGDTYRVDDSVLVEAEARLADTRGGAGAPPWGLFGLYALSGWFLPEMGVIHAGGLLLRRDARPFDLQLRFTYGAAAVQDRFFQYDIQVLEAAFAPVLKIPIYDADLLVGPILGASRMSQQPDDRAAASVAWSVNPGLFAGLMLPLGPSASVLLSWELDLYIVGLDGDVQALAAPKAVAGVGYVF